MSFYLTPTEQEKKNKLTRDFKSVLLDQKINGSAEALKYLEDRGIGREIIDKFNIGFYPKDYKIAKGLSSLFIGRIILPIQDEFGDTLVFSGRLPISKNELDKMNLSIKERGGKPIAKYHHESFPKYYFVYGLSVAWPYILHENSVVITEGQFDVLTCHKHGIKNVVGLMGSTFSGELFGKLNRFAEEFCFFLDGDESGREAAKSSIDIVKNYLDQDKYLDIKLNFKDKKYDPDEFLNAFGYDGYCKLLKKVKQNKEVLEKKCL